MEIMKLHDQWANRPVEERFLSLPLLRDKTYESKHNSVSRVLKLRDLQANHREDGGLEIVGPSGKPAALTNWAYNQLAVKSEFPAGYVAGLPAEIAKLNINYALQKVENQDIGMLLSRQDDSILIRAITGDSYTRIWNADVMDMLIDYVGDGTPDTGGVWQMPYIRGEKVPITVENTTFYGNDRNIFVCLTNESIAIEIPNRRDGKTGILKRFFILWNSEVGDQTFGIQDGYFDEVCGNRIIWGAHGVRTFKKRHTKNVLEKWQDGYLKIGEFANAGVLEDQTKLLAAVNYRVVDTGKTVLNESDTDKADRRSKEASKFLLDKLPLPQVPVKLVDGIKAAFVKAEQRPIDTLWDCVTAVTEYAKTIPYQEQRVPLERAGGKLLDLTVN
jgi:hypothetical protein